MSSPPPSLHPSSSAHFLLSMHLPHFNLYVLHSQRPSFPLRPHQNGGHLLPSLLPALPPVLIKEGLERLVLRALQVDLPYAYSSMAALLLLLLVLLLAGGFRSLACQKQKGVKRR